MQLHLPNISFRKQTPLFLLIIATICINLSYAQHGNFMETRPTKRFAVTSSSPNIILDLDYEKAFQVDITSFNGVANSTGFCVAYPSQIYTKMEWTGSIGELGGHSYDNIGYYKGYYFILDSISFNITVSNNFGKKPYFIIESEIHNEVDENGAFEEPFLLIDSTVGVLYIITGKQMLSYKIPDFTNITQQEIPKINAKLTNYKGYESILNVVSYQHRIYIVADNQVTVYKNDLDGKIYQDTEFTSAFFGVQDLAIVDIAFKGKYCFVLDKLYGVFLVDVSKASEKTYRPVSDVSVSLSKGQFIEVIGDSVNVISSASKNPFIYEYIIKGDPEILELVYNRKIELFQNVRDTYSDSNFLYILTGFFNLAVKHSVPGKYDTHAVRSYLTEYWPLFGAKALTSVTSNSASRVVAIQDNFVSIFKFYETNPVISCETGNLTEGLYTYNLRGVQKDCASKRSSITATFSDVCEITETIELLVTSDGSTIGNTEESNKTLQNLTIGVAVMAFILIIFLCIVCKQKSNVKNLENQIKFKKLEENTDQDIGSSGGRKAGSQEINPASINIQAELDKDAAREKKSSPTKGGNKPRDSPQEKPKPNAEFGDLKPLDLEDIYGGHKKDKDESF